VVHDRILIAAVLAATVGLIGPTAEQAQVFRIEGTSRIVIGVGKAGVFGFAGHAHQVLAPVTGSVTVDVSDPTRSEVLLEFDSRALRVTGEGEPEQDVAEVQQVMLSDRVLDATRYPKIVFRSRRITMGGKVGGALDVSVEGDLSLHGTTKPCVVPVRVRLTEGSLRAEGTTTIKQTDFGIEPVTAAGGSIRVKDALDITFTVQAVR
jgi:polyisoprenoid-binding protein YceI